MKYVANKDMRNLSKDLKAIYTAADEKSALAQLDRVTEKWKGLYPYAMKTGMLFLRYLSFQKMPELPFTRPMPLNHLILRSVG